MKVKDLSDFDARELINYGYCECLDESAGRVETGTEGSGEDTA